MQLLANCICTLKSTSSSARDTTTIKAQVPAIPILPYVNAVLNNCQLDSSPISNCRPVSPLELSCLTHTCHCLILQGKASTWLRRSLVLAAVVIIGWRLAFGSVARFAKALKEHKQRRKAFLNEWEQLKHRIDILVSLTSTLPAAAAATASSTSAFGTALPQPAAAAAIGGSLPPRVPTPGPNGGNGADFVMLELPRVDSGTGLSPLMSPAPEADQGGLPLPRHGMGFSGGTSGTSASDRVSGGVQGGSEQQGVAGFGSRWYPPPPAGAAGGGGGGVQATSTSSSSRVTQGGSSSSRRGQQEATQGPTAGGGGSTQESSTAMETEEGSLDEQGLLGGVPDPFRLGWGGVGALHGPPAQPEGAAAAGGGGRGGLTMQLAGAASLESDNGWVMDSPAAAVAGQEGAGAGAAGPTSSTGGQQRQQGQQEGEEGEEGEEDMEDEGEGEGREGGRVVASTVSPTMSDAIMLDYESGNGSE